MKEKQIKINSNPGYWNGKAALKRLWKLHYRKFQIMLKYMEILKHIVSQRQFLTNLKRG